MDDAEGTISSYMCEDLIFIDRTNVIDTTVGQLVRHVDDETSMGVIIELIRSGMMTVLWSIEPDLSTGGKLKRAIMKTLCNEIHRPCDTRRLSFLIENVCHMFALNNLIFDWSIKNTPTSTPGSQRFSVTFMTNRPMMQYQVLDIELS